MPKRGPGQLDLFAPAATREPAVRVWPDEIDHLAAALDPRIRLGTSSWTFPGWAGLCYPPDAVEARLLREGLSLYARFPLFRTVGIDRSYYRPLSRSELTDYAAQLPEGFPCVEKVWDQLVTPVFPSHPRYGARAGQANPDFLDPELFRAAIHAAHEGVFDEHLGAYVFEFPPMPAAARPKPAVFADRLARFIDALPKGPHYAVELRNRELFTPRYLDVLRDLGASHVYNYWGSMPSIADQLSAGDPPGEVLVSRLLLRPGTRYAERKAAFAPFDQILDPSEEMRADVVQLGRAAMLSDRTLHVLVNNKAEGSAPLTVAALARRMQPSAAPP